MQNADISVSKYTYTVKCHSRLRFLSGIGDSVIGDENVPGRKGSQRYKNLVKRWVMVGDVCNLTSEFW